jgi:molybdopterin-guanine dinucleotide biosynthesis protein B
MSPIISIFSKSKSGKTTIIEKLIQELKSRGYRVASIKHTPQGVNFDKLGKDSWRYIQASSETTAVSSSDKIALVKPINHEATIDKVASFLGEDYDVFLAEGFKQGSNLRIKVHRKDTGPPFRDIKKLIGIATDEPLETKARQFSSDRIKDIINLLEKSSIKPQAQRISLGINNVPISQTLFPKQIITNFLLAMASCLKSVGEIKSLQIFLKRVIISLKDYCRILGEYGCQECGECVRVCPVGALAFKDSEKGNHSIASISGIGLNREQGAY